MTVHKKDPSDPSAKLVGAEFALTRTDKDADPVVKTTGADGTVAFGFAEPGTWTLRETKAPAGYVLSDAAIQIVVGKDKLESITYDKGNAVWSWLYSLLFEKPEVTDNVLEFEDAKTLVKVSKVDVADGRELSGARIQVIDSEGAVVDEWVSTEEAHEVTGLKAGETYTLHEEVAPDGYAVAADTTFTIDETGKVASTGTVTSDGTLLVEDARESRTQSVKVSKVDVADGRELSGARIQVIDSEGAVVDEWVSETGEPHEVTGLRAGEAYTLHEEVAPDGYTVAADTTFTIDETGKVASTGTVTSDGTLLVEDARITKPDKPTTPEKPGKKLVQTSDPLAGWGTTALWTTMVGAALIAGGFRARGRREE